MKRKIPLWLRRLKQVKAELASERWPSAQAGFETGIRLMALGINLMGSKSREKNLSSFLKADQHWIRRWRRERGQVFSK